MAPAVDPPKLMELLTYCTDFAKQMLATHREFHPFGAQIGSDQKMACVGAWNGKEMPAGRELVQVLISGFRQAFAEGSIQAAAWAANVNIPPNFGPPFPDGIRVRIECLPDYARDFYIPYQIPKTGSLSSLMGKKKEIAYAEIITVDSHPSLLPQ